MTFPCCVELRKTDKSGDCVLLALKSIRQHYLSIRETAEEREIEFRDLQKRYTALQDAYNTLKREKRELSDSLKRKTAQQMQFTMNDSFDPIPASDLNMALLNDRMLDSSMQSLNSTQNETIPETENQAHYPLIFKKKETKADITLAQSESSTLHDVINLKNDKKVNLSLNKRNSNKMRQARLDFEREKSFKWNKSMDKTDNELQPGNRQVQAKPLRAAQSMFIGNNRTMHGENGVNDTNHTGKTGSIKRSMTSITTEQQHQQEAQKRPLTPAKDTSILFDYNTTPARAPMKNMEKVTAQSDLNANHMPLMPLTNKTNDSASCILLTPATQDIVFINDTDESGDEDLSISQAAKDVNKHIKTMDLLADVLKPTDNSLSNLKRLESVGIREQQRQAKKLKENSVNIANLPAARIKTEKCTETGFIDPDATFFNGAPQAQAVSPTSKPKTVTTNKSPRCADGFDFGDDDDYDENAGNTTGFGVASKKDAASNSKPCKKEKVDLNVECEDCKQYLRILGHQMTEAGLREFLEKCAHQDHADFMRQRTPEGFWNPLLVSFDENDPRNKVYVDTRFVGKKRKL